jgi:hypothetical protein
LNAKFEGAKSVPPMCPDFSISSKSPVFRRPSWSVENSPGRSSMILRAGGGGRIMWSTAWIIPLVPIYEREGL